jgi:hypothetical protein
VQLYPGDLSKIIKEQPMAELKTKPNDQSVGDFLNKVPDENKRQDSFAILELMKQVAGDEPIMWGDSIVGFGTYRYKYASGKEGEWPVTGFSPRKQNLTLYIMSGFDEYDDLLNKLGKHSTGKSCLYIKKMEDIDQYVLREIISKSVDHMTGNNE